VWRAPQLGARRSWCNSRVNHISLEPSWKSRLESLGARRHAPWVIAAATAVVVAAGALFTRPAPARIAPPGRPEAAAAAVLLVHVAGEVRRPGLYELAEGARVADAVEAAGGPRRGADLDALNLAAPVADGARIEVPARRPNAPSTVPGATPDVPETISINVADAAVLETIPGIGPVKAAAIVAHRDERGPFAAIEDLLDVTGIGPATLEQLRPYVSL
jgi:competence protein ComEA